MNEGQNGDSAAVQRRQIGKSVYGLQNAVKGSGTRDRARSKQVMRTVPYPSYPLDHYAVDFIMARQMGALRGEQGHFLPRLSPSPGYLMNEDLRPTGVVVCHISPIQDGDAQT
jgi:hypothetical protein